MGQENINGQTHRQSHAIHLLLFSPDSCRPLFRRSSVSSSYAFSRRRKTLANRIHGPLFPRSAAFVLFHPFVRCIPIFGFSFFPTFDSAGLIETIHPPVRIRQERQRGQSLVRVPFVLQKMATFVRVLLYRRATLPTR